MKIMTVVGARPQFIKAAVVSRKIRKQHQEILVHTGQHYDANMSEVFFEELSIPKPDYNLGVGSGTHARQTAAMLIGIEDLLLQEKPDALLVYGDTNSTLAAALAASKQLVPVYHVEAGLRSFNRAMPEEQNRVLTDHLSALLFAPTQTAVDNLAKEGLSKGVYAVGDVMCDAVLYYTASMEKQQKDKIFSGLKVLKGTTEGVHEWILATIHRAENTDTEEKLRQVLMAFEQLPYPVLFPVHPRTRQMAMAIMEKEHCHNTILVEPVGYLEMLFLTKYAEKVVTDSGGLQKEAYILHTPCVTVRDQTEWVETLRGNLNILARPSAADIVQKVVETKIDETARRPYYGEGDAADKIVALISSKGGNQ